MEELIFILPDGVKVSFMPPGNWIVPRIGEKVIIRGPDDVSGEGIVARVEWYFSIGNLHPVATVRLRPITDSVHAKPAKS